MFLFNENILGSRHPFSASLPLLSKHMETRLAYHAFFLIEATSYQQKYSKLLDQPQLSAPFAQRMKLEKIKCGLRYILPAASFN